MAPLKILNNSLFSYIYIFMCAFLSFFRIKTTNQTMHCNVQFPWRFCESLASLTARKHGVKCKNEEFLQMQSKRKVLKLLGKWLWNVKMRSAENFAFINPATSYSEDAPPRGQGALCVYVLLHQHLVIIDIWCTLQKIWTNYVHLQWLSILSISMCEVHDQKFKPKSCTLQTCTAG